MRAAIAVLLTAAAMVAGPAIAQKPRPVRVPPPIIRPVPVPAPRPPVAPPLSSNPQPECVSAARARVSGRTLCLVSAGRTPMIWQIRPWATPIDTVDLDSALSMLADRQFEALWPDLEALIGPGGTTLRDRMIAASAAAMARGQSLRPPRGTLEALNQGRVRAILDHAVLLASYGRAEEAIALLNTAADEQVAAGRLGGESGFDWVSLLLRRAQTEALMGDYAAAEATWRTIETRREVDGDYRLNAMVNRAALLAEQGRGAEALELIDAAIARFDSDSDEAIGGSNRQFAWIRACALLHVGRAEEARRALAPLRAAPEQVATWTLAPSTSSIEMRAAFCMRDVDWLEQLADGPNAATTPMWRIIQPGFRASLPGWDAVLPALRERLAGATAMRHIRELPVQYHPALRRWRDGDGAVTAAQ